MKYASDPYWGEKAAAVSWGLNDSAGGGDANTYTLAIKSGNTDVNIRAGSSTGTATLLVGTKKRILLILYEMKMWKMDILKYKAILL